MNEKPALSRITTRLAVTMSVILALAIPAGYFLISYQFIVGSLEAEAEINARLVSGIVSANPLLWKFEQVRLEELLARRPRGGSPETRRIFDAKGEMVAESSGDLPAPCVRRSNELMDAGVPVGRIEITRSLRPLVARTIFTTLFGLLAGLLVFRLLPYRAIITAQNKLEDANSFLNTVMESSTNAIIVLNVWGGMRLANRRTQEISGYSQTELAESQFLDLFSGKALEQVREELEKISSGHVASVVFETQLVTKNGQLIEISCGAAPFSQNGHRAGMVISAEDITKRKRAEQQLKNFAAELEETNAELRSFAYIISHDLRAPLVNIKGFAAELNSCIDDLYGAFNKQCCSLDPGEKTRMSAVFEQDIPEALDFINGSVVRMDRLINSVLKLSRIGHLEIKNEPVQLRDMVDSILKSMSHQIEERKATVTVGALPVIKGDRIAIEQIVGNLLDNAVKYLDRSRPGELSVFAETSTSAVTVHIRDNGRGIAKDDQAKIFEIFRRAGRQDVQGEGMGLAYVKTLVRKLHGQIWCQSEADSGSTFSFSLPLDGGHGALPIQSDRTEESRTQRGDGIGI